MFSPVCPITPLKPLRLALALFLSLALLANGWAATRLHAGAGVGVAVGAQAPAVEAAAALAHAADAMPPCHGAPAAVEAMDAAANPAAPAPEPTHADTGCCGTLCQHLCGLMLTLLPPAPAGAVGVAPATSAGTAPASEAFASHPAAGLWRPPRA